MTRLERKSLQEKWLRHSVMANAAAPNLRYSAPKGPDSIAQGKRSAALGNQTPRYPAPQGGAIPPRAVGATTGPHNDDAPGRTACVRSVYQRCNGCGRGYRLWCHVGPSSVVAHNGAPGSRTPLGYGLFVVRLPRAALRLPWAIEYDPFGVEARGGDKQSHIPRALGRLPYGCVGLDAPPP